MLYPEWHIKALVVLMAASIGLVACNRPADTSVTVITRIHGVVDGRAERLTDSATVRYSSGDGKQCVDLTIAAPTWEKEATVSGGTFCGERPSDDVWYGGSSGTYSPPSYDGLSVGGDLIYGIGPPELDAVVVTRDDAEVVVHTDEDAGMTAFVVWWSRPGSPSDPVPMVTVRPAS